MSVSPRISWMTELSRLSWAGHMLRVWVLGGNKELDYLDYLGVNGGMILKLFRNK